jgi:hypothetical protein
MFFKKPAQPAQPPPVREPSKPGTIYALVIGINKYPADRDWHSLSGAVADAEDFKSFLVDTLKVPSCNIGIMRNAGRRDIIDAIAKLKEGKLLVEPGKAVTIQPGSAFIFFYAGHGGRTSIPETWKKAGYVTTDGQVEQLIPSDIGAKDKSGHEVVGIPDRLISAVLKSLIDKIGDNIVSRLMLQP